MIVVVGLVGVVLVISNEPCSLQCWREVGGFSAPIRRAMCCRGRCGLGGVLVPVVLAEVVNVVLLFAVS